MKECLVHRETMSAVLDGAASPAEQASLEAHLATCQECRRALEELRWTHRQVRGLEPVEPPPWMTARIMARLRADAAPSPSIWRRAFFPILASAQFRVATLVLVGAAGYYLVSKSGGVPRDLPEARPASEATESRVVPEATPGRADGPTGERPAFAPPPTDGSKLRKEKKGAAPGLDERKDDGPSAGGGPEMASKAASAPAVESADQAMPAGAGASGASAPSAARDSLAGAAPSPRMSRSAPGPAAAKAAGSPIASESFKGEEAAAPAPTASPPLVVRIEPYQPAGFPALLERELGRAGAEVVTPIEKTDGRSVVARLPSRRLPELLQRLALAGSVHGTPESLEDLPAVIRVTLRW